MADGGSLIPALEVRRQRQVLAVLLVVLGVLGHVGWAVTVDASPDPFMASQAAQARASVAEVFPNATPPTVRVVLEAGPGGSVLSPEALTALETLRTRITSDELLLPVLASEEPVASVLEPLEPLLEGPPGAWDQRTVDSALENATRTTQGQRALALFLDRDATIRGSETRADATVLIVRLSGTAPPEALDAAEVRIQNLADESDGPGVSMTTDAPAIRETAARSAWGWWVPAVSLVLLAGGLLLLRRPWGQLGRAVALWLGGSGAALLAGVGLGQATPASLTIAHVAAGVGVAGVLAFAPRPPVVATGAALPVAALIGWGPAGIGALAAVATGGLVAPLLAGILWPAGRIEEAAGPGPWGWDAGHGWRLVVAGVLLVAGLSTLAFAGLPDQAEPGWTGQLPASTEAGQAEAALSTGFRGPGPASEFAVAAWGPVGEPGFLSGVDESSQRLERLSLAASGGQVRSVLTLAQDWAINDTDQDPTDDYDRSFAVLWEEATRDGRVPVDDVPEVLEALARLDPEGTRAVLDIQPTDGPRLTGAVLLRQRISLSDVVPRPGQAISAAIQPLLASSEDVAVTGSILSEERTRRALLDAQGPVVLATAAATVLAVVAWGARRGLPRETWGSLAGVTVGTLLVTLGLSTALDLPVRPITALAPGLAASASLLLGAPLVAGVGRALEGGGRVYEEAVTQTLETQRGWAPLVPVGAVGLAVLTVRAPGLQTDAVALVGGLLVAGLAAVVALPSLVRRWGYQEPLEAGAGSGLAPAQVACPVCDRATATAASRCRSCGTWNLVQACPAHPAALSSSCAECGTVLEDPSFG